MARISVDTDAVGQAAGRIEQINTELGDVLKKAQTQVDNLKNNNFGQALDATIGAFDTFAGKYFQVYHDVIQQYVEFLRKCVQQGYMETEQTNVTLAESFE